MLQNDLVSLIAPFYNGEIYLERFLISVLGQTYTRIQFILVNDGSTDGSEFIIKKYESLLKEKFEDFVYLKQENAGAAAAVNTALKYVNGEYLCWADCDDELLSDNIKNKYIFLKNNVEYGMVNCGARAIDQNNGHVITELSISEDLKKDNMFRQIINGIPVYPGVFMIRTQILFEKLNDREIYFNREAGQNYQLLLPVAYNTKCGFINDILYNYFIRLDSHSHNVDYKRSYDRTYVREELLDHVLEFMPQEEKDNLMETIHNECCIQRFNLSFNANDINTNKKNYKELRKCDKSIKIRTKHFIICNNLINRIYRIRSMKK